MKYFKLEKFQKRMPLALFVVAVLAAASFLYMRSDNLSSEDGFYHFRHAALYREQGIGISAFPWIPYSAIHTNAADIWYGFHLILIPFTWLRDPVAGLRFAGIVVTFATVLLFYGALRRLGAKRQFLWPFLLLFSSPFVAFRLAMARPHVLSLGLSVLLFSFYASGSRLGVFIASFAIAFLHVGLFWVPVLIAFVLAGVRIFTEKLIDWRLALALAAGLAAGALARPNPWGALHLAYIQIIQWMLEKMKGVPLHFGMELYPLRLADLGVFWGLIILWAAALTAFLWIWFWRKNGPEIEPHRRTILWASGLVSILFFAMTLGVAQRSFDFWAAFGVLFIALVFSCFIDREAVHKNLAWTPAVRWRITAASIALFVAIFVHSVYQQGQYLDAFGWPPFRFRGGAEWLKQNSASGSIVFNVSWDYFPELFFWNANNRYISGMDPIFQYVYDPALYWKAYYLETGKTDRFTCRATRCEAGELEDTHTVIKNDFHASYLFLSKPADSPLLRYSAEDPRFRIRYEDDWAAVVELK